MTKAEQLFELCKTKNFDNDLPLTLTEGINLNKVIESENTTFLYTAVTHGNFKMAEFLLKNGADPNFYAEMDGPVLWELQYRNDYEFSEKEQLSLVKLVLDYGADPHTTWDSDESLMDYVLWKVFNEISDDDWEYILKFFVYLIAYGGKLSNGMPEIYQTIEKDNLDEYKFFFTENESRGVIVRNGEVVAYI